MSETQPDANPSSMDKTVSFTVPRGCHGIFFTVFYGHLRKEVEITNLGTGELWAKQSYCYMGWHSCGVVSAIDADVNVEVRMRCWNTPCNALGASADVPLVLVNQVGGTHDNTSAQSFIFAPSDVGLQSDQFGITVVVQAGVGPIDVGL